VSKNYNVGIIGYSWAATAHIGAINATAQGQVTAIWSSRALDARELSERHGCAIKVHSSLEAMLADPDIHVVDITSYPDQHGEQFCLAARHRKHVIIEKPLAVEWPQVLQMKKAVAEAGIRTCVCFECRYSSQFLGTKAVIDGGLVGRLHYGEIDYYHGIGPWYGQYGWNIKKDMGGSALLTAGCHALDALLWCMNDEVVEVSSYGVKSKSRHFEPYEYPTTTSTLLKFKSGKVGKCAAVIDCLQPYYFHTHLVGSLGSLLDNKIYSEKLKGMVKTKWSTLETHLIDSGDVKDHPYQPQFQAFVDAVKAGKKMPLTDLDTALESHRVAFAADLSAEKGRPVKMSELK